APTLRVVNSLHVPVLQIAPGEVQLWRLANIGADIWYDVKLDGQQFAVIGEDGNPVWEVWRAGTLLLPPGKRFDVLVTGPPAGNYTLETLHYNQGGDTYPRAELASLHSAGTTVTTPALPVSLVAPAEISATDVAQKRTMVFTENEKTNQFFIN